MIITKQVNAGSTEDVKLVSADSFNGDALNFSTEELEIIFECLSDLISQNSFLPALFISFDCKHDSREAFNKLLKEGVIVRSLAVYKMPNYLRVSVGLPEENLSFLEKIKCLTRGSRTARQGAETTIE